MFLNRITQRFFNLKTTKVTKILEKRMSASSTPRASLGPSYIKIDENISVYGAFESAGTVNALHSSFKSVLYLATDVDTDTAADNAVFGGVRGFDAIASAGFSESSRAHFPLSIASHPCFAMPTAWSPSSISDVSPDEIMMPFRIMENMILRMPKPLVIVCKSNRRAGMLAMAYKAVNERLSVEEVASIATRLNLSYYSVEGLRNWVNSVIAITSTRDKPSIILRQLFESESSTYTYLLADPVSREAMLIDPVLETVERDAKQIRDLNLNLKYVLNTHVHADHITGSGNLKKIFPECKSAIAEVSQAASDVKLRDFSSIFIGNRHVYCLSTPGHTDGCMSFVLDDKSMVFTGDALLIRGCGRTDFQQGNSTTLYNSVHSKLFSLPKSTVVYPAHDYKGISCSSIQEESVHNPRLTKSLPEFIEIMQNLKLAPPKKLDASLPANMACGVF